MSQAGANSSSGGGGSGIQTINGDSGSITGSTVTIFTNQATNNSGQTLRFDNSGTVSALNVQDANGNIFFGKNAGNPTVSASGGANLGIGNSSMLLSTGTAEGNIALGTGALLRIQGDNNVVTGHNAGANVLGGASNCFYGNLSGNSLQTGTNSFFGTNSGKNMVTGSDNCIMGFNSGQALEGSGNTLLGANCAEASLSLTNNTALGWMAMNAATGAASNVALGVSSLENIQSNNNVCAGQSSMQTATSSTENVAVGTLAMFGETSGSNNTVVGHIGMRFTAGANSNVVIGHQAGTAYTTTESSNILIGAEVLGTTGDNNWVRIGNQGAGAGQQNNCQIAGIFGSTVVGSAVLCDSTGLLGTVVSSQRYKENVKLLPEDISVLKLEPVQFNYKKDPDKKVQYGLIAEQIHEQFPYLCLYDAEKRPESVKYHELPVLLLAEIQKLNKRVIELEKKLA